MLPPQAPVDPLTGLEAARLGVYVHFPWCLSKCPYCDFASLVAHVVPEAEYAQAVGRELERRLDETGARGREVHSIYFGGGTPSLWHPRYVEEVLGALAAAFRVAPGVEVTLEANPGTADASRFADYRAAGVNRLSIGMQSFQPRLLAALGRGHDGPTAVQAFEKARAAGFENLSLDLIYGAQGSTPQDAEADARQALALGPEHVSAYALTLDKASLAEEVPLARQLARGEVTLPEDDDVLAQQRAVMDVLGGQGLERYEVSNYARPGLHSRHNALYWTGGEYFALGAGATGRLGATRTSNHRGAPKYFQDVAAGRLPHASVEALSPEDLAFERLAMGLRLLSGLDLAAWALQSDRAWAPLEATAAKLVAEGLANWRAGRLALTPRGFDVHSSVVAALM